MPFVCAVSFPSSIGRGGLGYENGEWGYAEFTELQVVNAMK